MPITLTMIPKPSAEAAPETPVGKSRNTRRHHKSKRHQSASPTPPHKKHQVPTTPRRHSSSQNPRQLQPQDDPFSITGYIHEQVNTAVSKIPGFRWLSDTVTHPIIAAREKLDKFDGNMTQRRNNQDGSWLYPKGNRESSRKQREIDIDSLKRCHKKKIKKEEKRKLRKTSPEKRTAKTENREMVVYPSKKTLGDAIDFQASPHSSEKLFTIEDLSDSSRKRYRPKNLVKMTPVYNFSQGKLPFMTKLPTRDEFRFTPRLLQYESERQSGTVCNVVSSYNVDNEVIDQEPFEEKDYHLLTPEDERQSCERRGEWRNEEMRRISPPRTRGARAYSLSGYPRRNFRQDVNFIGIERVVPFSSSEEAISETHFPTRRDLNFARNGNLAHHVNTPVKPLAEEQVFETSHPIRKSSSRWMQDENTHNGLNDFSDENFLSMPKYVQVLPSCLVASPDFPIRAEEQSSARKYPKPRMEDEFQGLFVDQRKRIDANKVQNVENTPGQFRSHFSQALPNGTGAVPSNLIEKLSFDRKYPIPRNQNEFEGIFVSNHERVDADKAQEMEHAKFLPRYDQVLASSNIGSSYVFSSLAEQQNSAKSYLNPNEFEGSRFSQSRWVDAPHEVDILTDIDRHGDFPVFLLPSSRREGMDREQSSSKLKPKCNVFQFTGASNHQDPENNEEIPFFKPKILNNIFEVSELSGTFEIEHQETGEEVEVNALWKVNERSGFEQVSETDKIAGIAENSDLTQNSGLSETSGFDETSEPSENYGSSENSELVGNSGLASNSGETSEPHSRSSGLDENSELVGNSGLASNSGETSELHSGNSGLDEKSESENSDIKEYEGVPESNTTKDLVEEIKEVPQKQDDANDKTMEEATTSGNDDSVHEEKHQEPPTPNKFNKNKRCMAEKLKQLHGNIEQLGSELEELDILHLDKPYGSKDRNHDSDIANESSDSQEGCPLPWEDSQTVSNMEDFSIYKYGVLSQRKRHHIRDRMMAPSTVLRLKQQKQRARDSSQTRAIGNLASGLFKAIIQNGFGPKSTFSPSENTSDSTTNTAASLDENPQRTVSVAPSSIKIKKQVSFASQLSSECDSYLTDSETTDSRSQSKSNPCLSPSNHRDKLDLSVATTLDMPPTLNGIDDYSSATETASTAKTTSGVLYIKHKETSEEEKDNSSSFQLSYHNFPPLEDERQSDEAKETASEFEISSSEEDSESYDKKINGQFLLNRFQVLSSSQESTLNDDSNNRRDYLHGMGNQENSATRLSRAKRAPRWYNRFILGKRLSRVGPSQDNLPSRKTPTPAETLVNAVLLRATML